jgi:cellulose synthase/poly-beta-1,6-N-acetylglucosamine synthase-like glycosyltransferase
MIAFRRLFSSVDEVSADEEYIGSKIMKSGFMAVYVPDAVYYNKGPITLKGLIRQRRRIFSGHLFLMKRNRHVASTMSFSIIRHINKIPGLGWQIIFPLFFEFVSRFLGFIDFLRRKECIIWEISK